MRGEYSERPLRSKHKTSHYISLLKHYSQATGKINNDLRSVFTNKKIADEIKVTEAKTPFINQQYVVCELKCDLCDADYVGYIFQ